MYKMRITLMFLILFTVVTAVFTLPWLWNYICSSSIVVGERAYDDPCMAKNAGLYLKDYYQNGRLRYERNCKNARSNGVAREFYMDGTLKLEELYVDGKRQGLRKEYYASGALKKNLTFKDGQMNGSFKQYDLNGKLTYETSWKNDRPTSEGVKQYRYFANGNIKSEYFLRQVPGSSGIQVSYREFFENGKLQREYVSNSRGRIATYREYDAQDKIIAEQKDGFTGTRKFFYDDGKLQKEEHFIRGDLVEAMDYSPNGLIQVKLKDGKLSRYDGNGNFIGRKDVKGWSVENIAREYGELEKNYALSY